MRDTMKKELEAELVNVSGTARPSRKIRSEQDKKPEQEAVSEVVGPGHSDDSDAPQEIDEYELVDPVDILTPLEKTGFLNGVKATKWSEQKETVAEYELVDPQEIDEYELVDPVDILTPLKKTGFWNGVKATKWSERKEAVAELTKLASTKKIAPGDFTEICRTLKKLITDVNIAVAVEAIQAIGNLANGLRTHFSGNSRFLLPTLLEKLKEKNPTLAEALSQTLQTMHKSGCLNLADIAEDIKTAVKNKVPLVRSLTLNWVTFCIETSNKAVITKVHKEYVPIFMESLNDGTPDVRDAAFFALAAVDKMVGMRPLDESLEKLDDVRRNKLSEMIRGSGAGPVGAVAVQSSGGTVSTVDPVKKRGTAKSGVNKKGDESVELVDIKGFAIYFSEILEELKKTKDQMSLSKSTAKNELAAMSAKLEASQKQLFNLSASEQTLTEKLETIQNQHSTDLNNLKLELTENLSLVENLKRQLSDCKQSKSRSLELLTDSQVKLEIAKTVEENLKTEQIKTKEAYKSVALELEKLKTLMEGENKGSDMLKSEFVEAKAEVGQLKSALDLAEKRREYKKIQSTLQIEQTKAELARREVELEKAKDEVEQLKSTLDLAEKRCEEENKNDLGEKDSEAKTELKKLESEMRH